MEHQGFSIPNSQLQCVKDIHNEFIYGENFVLLSGNSGSGRTSLCEQVVSTLDNKFVTVFIPCQDQMSLEQLRQLFLQQVAPNDKWDDKLSLDLSFKSLSIPVRQRLLVVVDDVDLVLSTFFDELVELYKSNLGLNRFSFLVTAHPLWISTKVNEHKNDKLSFKEILCPNLTLEEALALSEQIFTFQGLTKVYKAILPTLPKALESCEGNVSKIIKLTEKLMNDPIEVNNENQLDEKKSPKKKGSAGIFISIICIVIVLACLVPVFFGSGFIDKLFGSKDNAAATDDKTQIVESIKNNDKLGFGEEENKVSDDPLSVSAGTVTDINAQGKKGGETAVADDGELLEKVEGGVEAQDTKPQPKNSVTIEGDTLNEIENKEADAKSDDPRQGLAGSIKEDTQKASDAANKVAPVATENKAQDNKAQENKEQETKAQESNPNNGEVVTLTRADNSLFKEQIAKEDAEKTAAQQKALEEQLAAQKALQEQAKKADAEKLAKNKANKEATDKASSKGNKTKELADSKKQDKTTDKTAQSTKKVVARAKRLAPPTPGTESELKSMNSNHYTLQVEAGTQRGPLLATADYVEGKYWIYQTMRNGRPWYVLIMGDYLTPREALNRVRVLPQHIRARGPFVKTFDEVKLQMRK